jgi:hypothetical protein
VPSIFVSIAAFTTEGTHLQQHAAPDRRRAELPHGPPARPPAEEAPDGDYHSGETAAV